MSGFESARVNLGRFDELAAQNSVIHQLDPVVKLFTALIFIVATASFPKYELTGILPLVLYPIVLISLGGLPSGFLIKRLLIAAPLAILVGVFNPFFDRTPLIQIGSFTISGGWISFINIMLKFSLTVFAALILVATSSFNEIGGALLRLKVPKVFVVQLLFTYRYLYVLIEEAGKMIRAYSLRSFRDKGVAFPVWGSLAGQMLLRALSRAERIYQAMLCRGFRGEIRLSERRKPGLWDLIFLLGWSGFFITARLVNIPLYLGSLLTGVGK